MPSFLRRLLGGSASPARGLSEWLVAEERIVDALAKADGLAAAAPDVLDAIGTCLHWRFGAVWVPDGRGERLRMIDDWRAPGFHGAELDRVSRAAALATGEGLPGLVWKTRAPQAVEDLEKVLVPARAAAAIAAGLRGAFAFPILHGERAASFHGVVELFDDQPVAIDSDLETAAQTLGKHLGQFVTRQRALRRVTASEAELSDLVTNAPVAIHSADADGRILLANREELDLLGYAREDYVGRNTTEFHVDPAVAADLLARLRDGEEVRLEAPMRAKDGSVRWLRIAANAVLRDGQFVHSRVFSRDVTQARADNARLRESERRFRSLVEGIRDHGFLTLDPQGLVTSWNPGAERLFGFSAGEIVGKPMDATFSEEDRAHAVPSRMVKIAADEGEFRHEGWRFKKDGSRVWAETVTSALRDASGRVEEITQLVRDLTERRRLEGFRSRSNELESANRSVIVANRRQEELLREISEAVVDPAAAVTQAAQRVRAAAQAGEPAATSDVDALSAGVADLRKTLDHMTEVAIVAARRIEFHPQPLDPLRLAIETRDLLKGAAAERRIRVDVDVEPSLTEVVADPVRLRQVVYNFLSNGIKASRERGRVAMRITPEGGEQFRVEVEDAGIGIPPERLSAVFSGRDEGGDGRKDESTTALGLAATKRIVEQQGGRVGAVSTVGRGSTFFAVLPRVLRQDETPAPAGEEATALRVLVVTDDASTRASLSWTLGSAGHEAVAASTPEEALDLARERACDAIAIDLLIGGTGAVDFASILREEGASRRARCLLACVGAGPAGVAVLGVADLVPRPPPADRLFGALERAAVPRGKAKPVLVVDGDLDALRATQKTLEILGYRAVAEPDADAALRVCADETPSAVILSSEPLGLDPFSFLLHLRRLPGLRQLPVLLAAPRQWTAEEADRVRALAATAMRDGAGEAARLVEAIEAGCAAPVESPA